jgi:hypothetical protein
MKKKILILLCIFFSFVDKIINAYTYKEPLSLLSVCQKLQENELDDENLDVEKNSKNYSKEILNYLQIFTFKEFYLEESINSSFEEINILNKCEINQDWQSDNSSSNDEMNNIFEGEEISRRSFRIKLDSICNQIRITQNNKVEITKIELVSDFTNFSTKNDFQIQSEISSVRLPKILNPGNSLDFFIDYNCNVNSSKDYLDIKIKITIDEDYFIGFSYIKICNQNIKFSSNSTYIFLILLFITLTYLCERDFLTLNVHIIPIQLEKIIHLKYAEHITIYSLIFFSFLILLGILTLFKPFAYSSGFILSLISVKFCIKSLIALINPSFNEQVSNSYFVISEKYNIHLSKSKVMYYIFALVIFSFWLIYFNNFILMNFIAFSVSYLVVKKFNFRNFYFILFLYSVVILYDIIWLCLHDVRFSDTFNLNSENIKIPIRFLLPEIIKSPFQTYYFFSILDLILIGFLIEYLKITTKVNNFNLNYLFFNF